VYDIYLTYIQSLYTWLKCFLKPDLYKLEALVEET